MISRQREHRKESFCTTNNDMKSAEESLQFTKKLVEIARLGNARSRKRGIQEIYHYHDDICYHGDRAGFSSLDHNQKRTSRKLAGLTAKRQRFDPHDHAHCCRCVQSFECFWPRSNLRTIRMQDYTSANVYNKCIVHIS